MSFLRTPQFLALGYLQFTQRGFRARQRSFTPGALDIDLSDRNFIVTGANSGLGRSAAVALASRGGNVSMVCRNRERGEAALETVRASAPNPEAVELWICDLGSLSDIKRFVKAWAASGPSEPPRPLHSLVNNAGLMVHERKETPDGVEMNFGVNVLGTYALTELLMPCLKAAGESRVVTVSSAGCLLAGKESLLPGSRTSDDLVTKGGANEAGADSKPKVDGQAAYARNKRCQLALTEHWAKRYAKSGVFWSVMHPGWASTDGLQNAMPEFHSALQSSLRTAEEGADTIVWLAAAEEAVKYPSSEFFFDRGVTPKHLPLAGTKYSSKDVASLVSALNTTLADKLDVDLSQ